MYLHFCHDSRVQSDPHATNRGPGDPYGWLQSPFWAVYEDLISVHIVQQPRFGYLETDHDANLILQ